MSKPGPVGQSKTLPKPRSMRLNKSPLQPEQAPSHHREDIVVIFFWDRTDYYITLVSKTKTLPFPEAFVVVRTAYTTTPASWL